MTAHLVRCQTLLRQAWSRVARNDEERGASLVEYAMLMALIALVCFGAVTVFGHATSSKLSVNADCFNAQCTGG